MFRTIIRNLTGLVYHNLIYIGGLLFIILTFVRLFFPEQKFFFIPDFGQSDVMHLNIPLKYLLASFLKNNQWPLWTETLGGGFPLLAEGQIGTFYLPNLIFFKYLPFETAFNLNLLLTYLISYSGVYYVARKFEMSKIISVFCGLVFAYSGFMHVHLNHFNFIQTASLFPWVFLSFMLLFDKPCFKYSFLTALILSQQFFCGYVYLTFITLIAVTIMLLERIIRCQKNIKKIYSIIFFSFVTGSAFIGLSAIQFLPTWELIAHSSRSSGLDFSIVTQYPFLPKNLIMFFKPDFFGTPKIGTFPQFSDNWGIYWENIGYIGIIPLFLAISSIFYLKNKSVRLLWFLLISSLLMVLGRYSPLYFLFSFPPFNYFRVPSRYLLITTFTLVLLSGLSLSKHLTILKNIVRFKFPLIRQYPSYVNKILIFIISIGIIFSISTDLLVYSYGYPDLLSSHEILKRPESVSAIPTGSRMISLGAKQEWNTIYLKDGAKDNHPFLFLKNYLYQNFNSLFNISNIRINTGGLIPRRINFTSMLLPDEINQDNLEESLKILSFFGIDIVISHTNLNSVNLTHLKRIISSDNRLHDIFVYRNNLSLPIAYTSFNTQKIEMIEDVQKIFANNTDTLLSKTIVEDDEINRFTSKHSFKPVEKYSVLPGRLSSWVNNEDEGLFVFSQNNYPGWEAKINGRTAKIFPVNINQMGIIVPSGRNDIEFSYNPEFFQTGKKITFLTLIIIFLSVFVPALVRYHRFSSRHRPSTSL